MKKNYSTSKNKSFFLYGRHAVVSAMKNPAREKTRLFLLKSTEKPELIPNDLAISIIEKTELESLLPKGAIHQGIALETSRLKSYTAEDIINMNKEKDSDIIVALDQVTDPHNIGAILRSMAAFDASSLIVQDKNAPEETGTLAKSACGALELIPIIRATNFVRTLETFKKAGYWVIGMDGKAEKTLAKLELPKKVIIVLGSEGDGMRRLTQEACDFMTKLPISPKMESLNVSNAAAVALYILKNS